MGSADSGAGGEPYLFGCSPPALWLGIVARPGKIEPIRPPEPSGGMADFREMHGAAGVGRPRPPCASRDPTHGRGAPGMRGLDTCTGCTPVTPLNTGVIDRRTERRSAEI